MAGPETAGFALVTRSELELAQKLTAGHPSEGRVLAEIEDTTVAELPVCLVGEEAKVVRNAVEDFLRGVAIRDYAEEAVRMNAGRRILFRALDSEAELQATG